MLNDLIRQQRVYRQESKLPLKDIRVIDLTTIVAASFAATLLADFGAEVIKIENPASPDGLRAWGVLEGGIQPWWLVVNRNKLPITLNLKTPEGAKIFAELIAKSDILTENMRSGALDRLGFTAERLFELNKGLIIGRISGYGQTGPYAPRPGFGTLAEGFSGYTYTPECPARRFASKSTHTTGRHDCRTTSGFWNYGCSQRCKKRGIRWTGNRYLTL